MPSPFPNPSDSEFMVQLGDEGEMKNIALHNAKLEPVYAAETTETEISIETRSIPEGLYVLRISGGGKSYSRHVQIKH